MSHWGKKTVLICYCGHQTKITTQALLTAVRRGGMYRADNSFFLKGRASAVDNTGAICEVRSRRPNRSVRNGGAVVGGRTLLLAPSGKAAPEVNTSCRGAVQARQELSRDGRLFLIQKRGECVAKGKYEYWLSEDGLTLLEGWARDGLTDEQIAHNVGITAKTLYEWKKTHSAICEALKKGKEVVDYEVENALLNKALIGDTTALIFWLKNRRPDKWRDKPAETAQEKPDNNLLEVIAEQPGEDMETDDLPEVQ